MIVLIILGLLAQVSPLVLYFVFYKKISKLVEVKVFFFYVVLSFASIIISGIFKSHQSIIISVFAICEFAFFSALLYLCIKNKKVKKIIFIVAILNLLIEIVLFYSLKSNFDFWAALLNAILIVIYSIYFFYEQINSQEAQVIYKSHQFWLVAGCIIYLSGTLFLFLYTAELKDKETSSLWIINIAFEIVKNISFSIAFILARNSSKQNLAMQYSNDTNMFEKPF